MIHIATATASSVGSPTPTTMMPRLLRTLAILIAIAGVIDPALTSTRTARPEIAVVAADSIRDAELANRVARELGEHFTVIPAPFAGAAATVVAGNHLPSFASELASPIFAVAATADGPTAILERVHAPMQTALDARVGIAATVRATGARGRTLQATLRMGSIVVDRVERPIATDDEPHEIALSFVPTALGAVLLRLETAIGGAGVATAGAAHSADAADLVVDVRDERWAVLFFDPRPSWLSTFVRRAVERDPRFVVTSRVVTSRNVSTDAGRPPGTFDDFAALSLFDAVIVGAPETLGERDVAGIGAYLRRRGGSVVLLLDRRASGAYDRLTQVRQWSGATGTAGFVVQPVGGDSGGLRASALAWPAALPTGARALALGRAAAANGSATHPVVWRSSVGGGELVVSGALDAWRYRDPAQSQFDGFWRTVIAGAAEAARSPIDIRIAAPVAAPGERTEVNVILRGASLAEPSAARPVRASVSAAILTPEGSTPIRLWPDGAAGHFRGSFRAPKSAGAYRVAVTGEGFRADAPLHVLETVARASPNESDLVGVWARAHRGEVISAAALRDLVPALQRTLEPVSRRETWYPMRSAWWVVPFALLLGAEWLWRRRRGLA